jgi:hypothetical protein
MTANQQRHGQWPDHFKAAANKTQPAQHWHNQLFCLFCKQLHLAQSLMQPEQMLLTAMLCPLVEKQCYCTWMKSSKQACKRLFYHTQDAPV